NEIMTGWIGPGTSLPISRITVASLADLGYSVNIAAADPFAPPGSVSSSFASTTGTSGGTAGVLSPEEISSAVDQALAAINTFRQGVRSFVDEVTQRPRQTPLEDSVDALLVDAATLRESLREIFLV
ncbi:MAG TPA: hypothetical protein VFB80_21925, partial [Pirellulaceae bacterium]|nr:hypothetical protein [Pirellulaceae bacterium]